MTEKGLLYHETSIINSTPKEAISQMCKLQAGYSWDLEDWQRDIN